jgi:hypothetical protein
MTDEQIAVLVQLLMNGSALGRLAHDEAVAVIELMESAGYVIEVPA